GEEPAIDQGFDDGLGEFPDFVVFVRGRGDQGHEITRFLYLRMDGQHGVSPAPRKRGPIDYRRAGRSGQAMATQGERLDEAVASSGRGRVSALHLDTDVLPTLRPLVVMRSVGIRTDGGSRVAMSAQPSLADIAISRPSVRSRHPWTTRRTSAID